MAQQYIQQLTVFLRGGQNVVIPFNAEKPEVLNPQIDAFIKAIGDKAKNQGNFLFQGARVVLIHIPDVSGLDVVSLVRKEEAAVADWSEETVAMCAARQIEILRTAASLLRPGGRLVYSTCTFAPQENEGTISAFLQEHPDFSVIPIGSPYFSPGRPDWIADPAAGLEGTARLWPHHLRGEGHFAAVLQKSGDAPGRQIPTEPGIKAPKEVAEFASTAGAALPEGKFVPFGARVFLAPEELPMLRGLRVLRCGLELGELRKGRLDPAHAWALWLQTGALTLDLDRNDPLLRRYMAGESIPADFAGWTLVQVEGCTLGWGKGSGGQLKNHYPKALRRPL